jgi:hypothetical protein
MLTVTVSQPTYRAAEILTQEDVWGKCVPGEGRLSMGMLIALPGETCPHFMDVVASKSVTVRVPREIYLDGQRLTDVLYWLEYVQGAGTIQWTDNDDEGNLIIRAAYMCW